MIARLVAWWLRARAWVVASLAGLLGLVVLALGLRRWGAGQRTEGQREGAQTARVDGLEAARADDAARTEAELELDAATDAAEVEALREADRRADGPLTLEDVEALRRRTDARRARGGGGR